jgi:CTP:molybdopterin cytidylyltransferase MocA
MKGVSEGVGMSKPDLIVMAAGIGSRYGGLKQIEPIGPGGEIILDYSIFDARNAGFGKIIFVINKKIQHMYTRSWQTYLKVVNTHQNGQNPGALPMLF